MLYKVRCALVPSLWEVERERRERSPNTMGHGVRGSDGAFSEVDSTALASIEQMGSGGIARACPRDARIPLVPTSLRHGKIFLCPAEVPRALVPSLWEVGATPIVATDNEACLDR